MKTNHSILGIAATTLAAATLLSACLKEDAQLQAQNTNTADGEYELVVEVGQTQATKTAITQDGTILPVVWKTGDKLYVAGATDGYIGCLELEATQASGEGVGYHTAKFKGKMSGWTSTQVLHFYYLGSSEPTLTGDKFTFDISSQEGTLAWIEASGHISHAATSSALAPGSHTLSLTMSNMNAVILYDLSEWTSGVAISGTFNKAVLDLKAGTFDTTSCTGDIALAADKCTASTYVTFIPDNKALTFKKGAASTPTKANNVEAGKFYSNAGAAIKITKLQLDGYIEHDVNWGPGIEVNGVIWAPVNCGIWDGEYPVGKFYQWNRQYGQVMNSDPTFVNETQASAAAGNDVSFKDSFFKNAGCWYSGSSVYDTWTYNPCPEGWRTPTIDEIRVLMAAGYATATGMTFDGKTGGSYSGYVFGSGDNKIFLPGNGYRAGQSGYYVTDAVVNYWSSTSGSNENYGQYLCTYDYNVHVASDIRSNGYNVRCVYDSTVSGSIGSYKNEDTSW